MSFSQNQLGNTYMMQLGLISIKVKTFLKSVAIYAATVYLTIFANGNPGKLAFLTTLQSDFG